MDDVSSTVSQPPDTSRLTVDELTRAIVTHRNKLGTLPEGWCWEEVTEIHDGQRAFGFLTTWRPVRLTTRGQPFAQRFIPKRPHHG